MKLHEQRNELRQLVTAVYDDLVALTSRIQRKTACPYGDGSYSDMVNANTDVLPQLTDIRMKLLTGLHDATYGQAE